MIPSRMYGFVRSRQLEGTFPGSPETGVWASTAMRIGKGWGTLEESQWPFVGDASNWPPSEPEGLDHLAKAHRILAYQRASTIEECRVLIYRQYGVIAAFEIDDSWRRPPKGVIEEPCDQPITASHAVHLIGYNDATQRFTFWNCWGREWGDGGLGYLPYSYFRGRLLEGWNFTPHDSFPIPKDSDQIKSRTWQINDWLGNILHGAEIVDPLLNEVIAWGFAIEGRSAFLELEELFVRPNWRMRGYASQLTTHFSQLAARLKKQIRAWIPHSDAGGLDQLPLNAVLPRLGLSRNPSPERWAAAIGIPNIFLDFWLRRKTMKNES
jgi:GNAT superfamily N-acetyltransferase